MIAATLMNMSARHARRALARALRFAAALLCGGAALADDPWALPPERPQAERAKRAAAGDLWKRIRRGFAMPDLQNGTVEQSEARYKRASAEMTAMLERSRPYLYHIVEQLHQPRGIGLDAEDLRVLEAALHAYMDDFGHEEADVLRQAKATLAKVRAT